jgi:predicted alpha/beta hydrolase family esterase
MNKRAIIIHGKNDLEEFLTYKDSSSNAHWIPWLQNELSRKGILTQTPEMPKPYEPAYEEWLKVFSQYYIDENVILIGHSCGAGFLVRYLSENNTKVDKVYLVAPWLDTEKEMRNTFFDFTIDKNIFEKADEFNVLYSTDDMSSVLDSVEILKSEFGENANFVEFTNKGHFCESDLNGREFPDLLKLILLGS